MVDRLHPGLVLKRFDPERGASALIIAMSLFLLMGFAAIAIDLSVGFNERRQDQTAADIGVMAGAVETLGPNTLIRDMILDFTRRNVIATYSNADWQARWQACTDPERATLNASGFNFQPATAPAGWSTATIDCISFDAGGYVRVNLPDLEFDTTFGKILGVDEMQTNADAIAHIGPRGRAHILPFGLLLGAGEGTHVCLRDTAGGLNEPPCDGTDAGNFGAIDSPHYGTQPDGPDQNCTGSPKSDLIAVNIAYGIDHRIIPDPDGLAANEVLDTCANMDAGRTPDTLDTFTGISQGIPEGLATGPVPDGITDPLLQQGSNPERNVHGYPLDDKPLWEYIDPALSVSNSPPSDLPAICERGTFHPFPTNPLQDWDGDGVDDEPDSWEHLGACLSQYVAGGDTAQLFLDTLAESARFGYVPQFWENEWPSGTSGPRHIWRFKATWLQATWWKKGGTTDVFHPGEPATFLPGGSWKLIQLSAIIIPDSALPSELRGNPPPGGGVNPFTPELFR